MKISKYLFFILLICMVWSCKEDEGEVEKVVEITKAVKAIAIDATNTKWVGTDNGLYKSVEGGFELVKLSVPGEIHSLFYEMSKEILWIGTGTSLISATITDGKLTEKVVPSENLNNSKVRSFNFDDNSKHFFGTDIGFGLNKGEVWKKENFRVNVQGSLFKMQIEDFAINSIASYEGDYFFATSGAKLYRAFDYDETVDAFSGATQWDPPYNGESITDTMFVVFVDKDGKQWMGGKEGIQVHIGHDPKDLESFTYYYDELPDNYVFAINQAPNGDIWVGTRKGLAVYNGSIWTVITNNLPDLYISSIAFENDGSAWIGTQKGLVAIYN